MSQSRPCHCPPLPISRNDPAAPVRWPLVLAAAALGGLLLTLVTLTAWVSAGSPAANPEPPTIVQAATPEAVPEEPPPPGDAAKILVAQEPPPVAPPGPADPAPEAIAASSPGPRIEPPPAIAGDPVAPSCQRFGTAVDFLSDPTEAARQAGKTKKLLFVLHVSGNFENDRFT